MPGYIETRTRLDELLDQDRLSDDLKVIGSLLLEVC
jgi:hypothetical protein